MTETQCKHWWQEVEYFIFYYFLYISLTSEMTFLFLTFKLNTDLFDYIRKEQCKDEALGLINKECNGVTELNQMGICYCLTY